MHNESTSYIYIDLIVEPYLEFRLSVFCYCFNSVNLALNIGIKIVKSVPPMTNTMGKKPATQSNIYIIDDRFNM